MHRSASPLRLRPSKASPTRAPLTTVMGEEAVQGAPGESSGHRAFPYIENSRIAKLLQEARGQVQLGSGGQGLMAAESGLHSRRLIPASSGRDEDIPGRRRRPGLRVQGGVAVQRSRSSLMSPGMNTHVVEHGQPLDPILPRELAPGAAAASLHSGNFLDEESGRRGTVLLSPSPFKACRSTSALILPLTPLWSAIMAL